jgi:hypothetical protein
MLRVAMTGGFAILALSGGVSGERSDDVYRRVTWDGLSEGLRGRDRGGGQGKGLRPGYLMEGGPLRKVCGSGYE